MSDVYQEEYRADARHYVLWCEGRLEELRQANVFGVVPAAITEMGMETYRNLPEFIPDRTKVISTLESFDRFEARYIEKIANLLMGEATLTGM
jgi:hypothetical protein